MLLLNFCGMSLCVYVFRCLQDLCYRSLVDASVLNPLCLEAFPAHTMIKTATLLGSLIAKLQNLANIFVLCYSFFLLLCYAGSDDHYYYQPKFQFGDFSKKQEMLFGNMMSVRNQSGS